MKNRDILCTTILLLFGCFGPLPKAQAVVPPPDGGYPGGNTAEGQAALLSLTTGTFNTAVGWFSLRALTTGSLNTAIGAGTLLANTGDGNTAAGTAALLTNTTGFENTANGGFALFSNTMGFGNTASGHNALFNNTTGSSNTASGDSALFSNTGSFNTAIGTGALYSNTTGSNNIALGVSAGFSVTTADDVIAIGSSGANVSNSCFIGNIRGVTTGLPDAIQVLIDSAGQLGTISSSRRFKHNIKPMDKASEAILALKPVTFHYKSDKTCTPQFGLTAEEVAEVTPDLVVRDERGEIYTVRYDAVNAMLLNEFLKEHRKLEQLKKNVASKFVQQQKQIEALTAGLRRVSAQIEMSKTAPNVAHNNL